ncbi:receptor-like protein 12 [Solanum tuberosum]|uniref:receptor-like protein 12 n=1 Tax=Solanum tuberosum TaxID=4113 RepID=UPI00073A2F9E|nr:PREDICTED: receptor-like protein 12 [Solanum tuberosum]
MGRFFFFYSFLCFVLLISECFSSSFDHHLCSPTEASALLQFKQSSQITYFSFLGDGASFPKTESWNESRDCCSWDGVTCDLLNGHVIRLDLSCSQLFGTFHPNSTLFQLHHLQTLNLDSNYFNPSSIPNGIGRLTNLRHKTLCWNGLQLDERTFEAMFQNFTNLEILSLFEVNISSAIPVNISSSSLRYLDLGYTNLRGVLTESFFLPSNSLETLKLSDNDLLKGVFPKIHRSNTLLMELDISNTGISGELPHSIGTFSSLNILNLHRCQFSGSIPHSIGNLTQIRELDLSNNHFTGHIPSTISKLKHLRILYLSDNSFSGEIPDVFSNLQKLSYLDLSSNSFSGEIPDVFSNLQKLSYLDLSSNSFSGEIPDVFSNLQKLSYLDLSSNSFSGEIPDVFSNLKELRTLHLSNNSFIGSFPSSILSLTHLEYLDMSSNSLSGPLPSNPSMLQKLTSVDLTYNSQNGTIPSSVFSLPLLSSVSLQHNRFRRLADEVIKTNPTLKELHLSNNQLSGSFPQSLVNLTNLFTLDISSNNITIDEGMNITFLSLSSLFLSGSLPAKVFGNFKAMIKLDGEDTGNIKYMESVLNSSFDTSYEDSVTYHLYSYHLCELKDFPHFLRNVTTLQYLGISNNKICGQIPNWFSGMRWDSLQFLNLSHNSLTGHLPQFHFHSLEYLDLKFNSLQGPLPSSICNMRKLTLLDLSRNHFSNSIPSCLGSMSSLTVLDLRRNNFTGSLPSLCAQSTSLSTIVINGNRFEGSVPVSLLKCHSLEVLDVGNNAINDTFPAWLGTLQVLQVLILKSNKFHGPISTYQTMFCFPKLRIFDLSSNEFSGSLPAKFFRNFKAMIKLDGEETGEIKYMKPSEKSYMSYEDSVSLVIKGQDIELQRISTITTTIDLSSNHFEGVIPETLKDLSSLWLLNLSHNNLIGHIPMELGQLNTLEALDLSWNRLTGKIPQELTRMNFLAFLNVSQNHLVGPIPHGLQFNTFENDSYGGNLDLCGPPLSKQCGTSDSSHVPQPLESEQDESESYFFSGFTWESVVIGYSCGLVVGTIMWSLMFKYRKPKWFVEFFDGLMPHERTRPKKRAQRLRT